MDAFHSNEKDDLHPEPWWRVTHLSYLNWCIFLITLSSTNNGYDGSMLNGLQSLTYWGKKMGHPQGAVLGALTNGTVFGTVLAFPIASFFSDKWGRKKAVLLGQVILIIGAMIQGASVNYAMFLVSRVILGFGSCIAAVSSPAWVSEIAYPSHRQVATTFYNTCWYLGAVIAAWVTYGTRNLASNYAWRIPSYCQAAIPLFQVCTIFMIPEFPRYLVSKDRIADARAVLMKHHGGGDEAVASKMVDFELAEIQTALEMERIADNSKYSDFLKTPANRKRLFLVIMVATMTQLSGNGLVSYYLPKVLNSIGITSPDRQLIINGGLMIYNLGTASFVALIAGMFKRRTMFLTSCFLMCLFYVVWTALSAINQQRDFKDKLLASGVLAMIFMYYASYNIGMNGVPFLYITEILPYSLRVKGLNIGNSWIAICLIYNGFVNPVAMDAIEWRYYIVYCCILAVEFAVVYFTFVETAGYSLEEVAKVFGEDPADFNGLGMNFGSTVQEVKHSMEHDESP
ncbi:hypothetical protein BABINDRAFT_181856 [Babjeviella inositovora NRRL Y-12698]|uniref:Major facilitator superfamily (MFS) profile domain-containing protein n=1 Tax=Babjeviella inositovora NRRL Y-12698 TaxID=984486 RepID=A0A1E3QHR6_9ASCO|nr:uncharacterized protein BABINDRAFT_181856 [Babjeviella inositovora NRRL Y-12698]ODQ77245.1 hypothetical protein BABINDRAFT_181856 [Babjeviella inositovora NRRL Y-12698]